MISTSTASPPDPLPSRRRWAISPVVDGLAAVAAGRTLGGLAAIAAVLALAACGSSQTTSSPSARTTTTSATASAPAGSVAACRQSQLELSYAGTEGATGHLELTLALRNVSTRPCTLRGYASARLLDSAGRALPMRLDRGAGFFPDTRVRPRRVMLAPGSRARYGLSFVTNNEYAGARRCVRAAALMSRAPGASRWTRVTLSRAGRPQIVPCGRQLVLSPVYAS